MSANPQIEAARRRLDARKQQRLQILALAKADVKQKLAANDSSHPKYQAWSVKLVQLENSIANLEDGLTESGLTVEQFANSAGVVLPRR